MNKALLLILCAAALRAEAPAVFAIRDARIVIVSGPELKRGTVVLRRGLIEAVGENVPVPAEATVIDGSGLIVYPGLIDGLSTWGLPEPAPPPASTPAGRGQSTPRSTPAPAPSGPPARGPEDRPSNTSWLRAADLISPTERRIEAARSAGFTTAVAFPTTGIFAGQGAVINLAGERPGAMIVSSPAGLYLSTTTSGFTSFPGSLMGVLAYIRQVFLDADHYKLVKQEYARHPTGIERPAYDRALEGMLDAPRVLLPATRAIDVERMIHFAAELKVNPVLYGGHGAYRRAELLARSRVPLLISLKWPERSRDADPEMLESLRTLEVRDRAPSAPAALAKAGASFAFYSDGIASPKDILKAVKRAIDSGLSEADAVRAMTLSAARIYAVDDRLGSIEKGKIANLVLTDGELFQEKTKIKCVFVDGKKYEPVPEPAEDRNR